MLPGLKATTTTLRKLNAAVSILNTHPSLILLLLLLLLPVTDTICMTDGDQENIQLQTEEKDHEPKR